MKGRIFRKTLSWIIVFSLSTTALFLPTARAEWITTQELASHGDSGVRDHIYSVLARDEVISELARYGVSAEEAKARVASLSDEEAREFGSHLDHAIAGGDGLSTVVVAIVAVFLILLLTDIMGLTKVYPFTRSVH